MSDKEKAAAEEKEKAAAAERERQRQPEQSPPDVEHPEAAEIPPPPGLVTGDEHGEVQDEAKDG